MSASSLRQFPPPSLSLSLSAPCNHIWPAKDSESAQENNSIIGLSELRGCGSLSLLKDGLAEIYGRITAYYICSLLPVTLCHTWHLVIFIYRVLIKNPTSKLTVKNNAQNAHLLRCYMYTNTIHDIYEYIVLSTFILRDLLLNIDRVPFRQHWGQFMKATSPSKRSRIVFRICSRKDVIIINFIIQ